MSFFSLFQFLVYMTTRPSPTVCKIFCKPASAQRRSGLYIQTAKPSVFSSKSVKKSVKCGGTVLLARSARAHTPYGRVRRLSPVSLSVFSLVLDLLFDCSRVLEYAKIRTVLQSNFTHILISCARAVYEEGDKTSPFLSSGVSFGSSSNKLI